MDGLSSEMNQKESVEISDTPVEDPVVEENVPEPEVVEPDVVEQPEGSGDNVSATQNDDDDDSDSSSATVATVEIKVVEPIPDVVPIQESTTELIDEDDKATLTKTTDLENEQKEAREKKPTAFDGIMEPGQKVRRPSVQNTWARKRQKMKTIWKLWSGIFVCVVMPITIYVVDIIITVNVVERKVYKESLSYYHDTTNKDNLPVPTTEMLLGYSYNITDTLLMEILELSKHHADREKDEFVKENGTFKEFLVKKRSSRDLPTFDGGYVIRYRREEDENDPDHDHADDMTHDHDHGDEKADDHSHDEIKTDEVKAGEVETVEVKADEVKAAVPKDDHDDETSDDHDHDDDKADDQDENETETEAVTPASPTSASNTTAKVASEKDLKERQEEIVLKAKEMEKRKDAYYKFRHELNDKIHYNFGNDTEFGDKQAHCEKLRDFYIRHENTAKERNDGWFEFVMKKVAQLQQILFILFTIFGFILCILSIALRADMWFKDEWSSFILGTYVPYIISTCLCALIFVKESGKGGLRCFICRLANDNLCEDIDPLAINSYPSSFPWLTMVLLSYALKLLDCFIIGGTTLTFVMEKKNSLWQLIFKFIGWMIVFPWLVATPLLGIFRYQVIAEIFPPSEIVAIETILTGFFYCGIALWGVLIIAGPVFCKLRMCDVEDNPLEKDDF